jgi:hypothetical protein
MILYESEAKQAKNDTIQLSDSLSNYNQVTFIVTLYEDNEDVGGIKHNIYQQIKSPSTSTFGITAYINSIHSTWMFQKSGANNLIINDKSSENWDNSKIGISKIIGY